MAAEFKNKRANFNQGFNRSRNFLPKGKNKKIQRMTNR